MYRIYIEMATQADIYETAALGLSHGFEVLLLVQWILKPRGEIVTGIINEGLLFLKDAELEDLLRNWGPLKD